MLNDGHDIRPQFLCLHIVTHRDIDSVFFFHSSVPYISVLKSKSMLLSVAIMFIAGTTLALSQGKATFLPRDSPYSPHNGIARRNCVGAAPSVDETAVSVG